MDSFSKVGLLCSGTWYYILEFLNMLGVVTNACLIAFTSEWGQKFDITGQLVIVIGFEVQLEINYNM